VTTPVPGPPASVLAAILRQSPSHPYDPSQARRATFSGSNYPDLPSLTNDVVALPQYAYLDANVEVAGALASNGWATGAVKSVTAAYTPTPADAVILADATSGPFTVTLPDATQVGFFPGQRYTVKKTDATSSVVTLAASAGQLIDGASTQAISPAQSAISVVFSGTAWEVTSGGSAIGTNSVGGVTVSGTPSAGQVLTATSPSAADWAAGGLTDPMTTLGDMIYENATPAPARLAGSTSATRNFLTQTGTGAVSAAPAWGILAAGDLPTGTTSAQGALQLDGTAADIQAPGTQAAGAKGQAADAEHVHPASFTATAYVAPAVSALTDGTTISVNAALGNVFTVTLGGNRTLGNPTNPVDGQKIIFRITQDGSGSRTLAYGTAYAFSATLPQPVLTTTAGKTDYLGFIYAASVSKWRLLALVQGF